MKAGKHKTDKALIASASTPQINFARVVVLHRVTIFEAWDMLGQLPPKGKISTDEFDKSWFEAGPKK